MYLFTLSDDPDLCLCHGRLTDAIYEGMVGFTPMWFTSQLSIRGKKA